MTYKSIQLRKNVSDLRSKVFDVPILKFNLYFILICILITFIDICSRRRIICASNLIHAASQQKNDDEEKFTMNCNNSIVIFLLLHNINKIHDMTTFSMSLFN